MISSQRRAASDTSAATRARLVDATVAIIAGNGPQAATSRAIAEAAGENLGAITYYFGSKDSLVAESLAATARQMIEPVVAHLTDPTGDPVSRMLTAAQLLQQLLDRNEAQLPAYVHSLAAATCDGTVRNEVQALHRAVASALAGEMAAQIATASLPIWVEPDPMARLIVALVNGVAVAKAISPDETDASAIATQFALLLLATRAR